MILQPTITALGGEAAPPAQSGRAAGLDELLVLAVVAGGDDDVAIQAGEGLVGHDVGVGIAPALGRLAAVEVIAADIGQHRHLRV